MEVKFGPDLRYFLCSLILGLALAALYDLLRFSRKIIHTADIAVNIEDILFIAISGAALGATAYLVNNGLFRIYSVLSTVFGFALYRLVLGSRLVRLLTLLYSTVCRVLLSAAKVILLPLSFIINKLGKPLIITIGSTGRKFRHKCPKNAK